MCSRMPYQPSPSRADRNHSRPAGVPSPNRAVAPGVRRRGRRRACRGARGTDTPPRSRSTRPRRRTHSTARTRSTRAAPPTRPGAARTGRSLPVAANARCVVGLGSERRSHSSGVSVRRGGPLRRRPPVLGVRPDAGSVGRVPDAIPRRIPGVRARRRVRRVRPGARRRGAARRLPARRGPHETRDRNPRAVVRTPCAGGRRTRHSMTLPCHSTGGNTPGRSSTGSRSGTGRPCRSEFGQAVSYAANR